jgi:hypothetical protein
MNNDGARLNDPFARRTAGTVPAEVCAATGIPEMKKEPKNS